MEDRISCLPKNQNSPLRDRKKIKMQDIEKYRISKFYRVRKISSLPHIPFNNLLELLPDCVFDKLSANEICELLNVLYRSNCKSDRSYSESIDIQGTIDCENQALGYASVQYAVNVLDEYAISTPKAKEIGRFTAYSEAVRFLENVEGMTFGERYFIMFIAYDEFGNEICHGIVNENK